MKKLLNDKGVTLLALVITIIILLILAAVSMSMLSGENSVIHNAQTAKEEYNNKAIEEDEKLNGYDEVFGKNRGGQSNGGDQTNPQKQIDQASLETLVATASSGGQVDLDTLATSAEEAGFTVSTDKTLYTKNGTTFVVSKKTCLVNENGWKAYGLTSNNVVFDREYVLHDAKDDSNEVVKLYSSPLDTYWGEFPGPTKISYSTGLTYFEAGYVVIGENYVLSNNGTNYALFEFNNDNTVTGYFVGTNVAFDVDAIKAAEPAGNGTYILSTNSN